MEIAITLTLRMAAGFHSPPEGLPCYGQRGNVFSRSSGRQAGTVLGTSVLSGKNREMGTAWSMTCSCRIVLNLTQGTQAGRISHNLTFASRRPSAWHFDLTGIVDFHC